MSVRCASTTIRNNRVIGAQEGSDGMTHDTSRRGRRNVPLLVTGIFLAVLGVLSSIGPFITLVASIIDGTANGWDVFGRLAALLLFLALVYWLVTARTTTESAPPPQLPTAAEIAALPQDSPERQALIDEFRRRQSDALTAAAQPLQAPFDNTDPGDLVRRRSPDDADAEIALAGAVYRDGLRPSQRSLPTLLQGPYLGLGAWAWGSLLFALVLIIWGSTPRTAVLDAGAAALALPLWALAAASAARATAGPGAHQNTLQTFGYGVIRRAWMSPAFAWTFVLLLVAIMVAAMLWLMAWNSPVRPGLGVVEVVMLSYGGWGGGLAIVLALWSTGGERIRKAGS